MDDPKLAVRASSVQLDLHDLLRQPPSELLGVSAAAASVLASVGIKNVFDLGVSQLFAAARAVVEFARQGSLAQRAGLAPGDLIADGAATPSADLGLLPVGALRLLSANAATALAGNLGVTTIRDMAAWPPGRAAQRLVGLMTGADEDPEGVLAEELRPQLGLFPTERVYYSSLAMFQTQDAAGPLQDLTGPVSLQAAPTAFGKPAVGALLTFAQSWHAQGVTLGQLLHSVALAPGEATRIAVVDWTRRTSARAEEAIDENERLDNAMLHARSVSEVQQAVANDFQAGGSRSSTTSSSSSSADASAEGSGLILSVLESTDNSFSSQEAAAASESASSSWSVGNRSVLASMVQNVNDRTEQHAASARSRRAAAVREVSQSEHESISTRVVANYNHMHALTVQYFEVVQVYRVSAQLQRADRCLFVPMELLDFTGTAGQQTVERFRGALTRAALNPRVRELLADDRTAVEVDPVTPVKGVHRRPDLLKLRAEQREQLFVRSGRRITSQAAARVPDTATSHPDKPAGGSAGPAAPAPTPAPGAGTSTGTPPGTGSTDGGTSGSTPAAQSPGQLRIWDLREAALAARILNRPVFRPNSDSLFVSDDTELAGVSFDGIAIAAVKFDRGGATPAADQTVTVPVGASRIDAPEGLRLVDLDALAVAKTSAAADTGTMTLHCARLGRYFNLPAIPLDLPAGTAMTAVVRFRSDQANRRSELLQALQADREHYSRAVFQSLDAATLTMVLSKFKWNNRALIEQVEPRPVAVAGNYLILRAPVEPDEDSGVRQGNAALKWGELLTSRGVDFAKAPDQRLVPVPTGGVFAEAVLGRANSAEKLDITRFWNWQDSPIPLAPPEISPVAAGSRATAENLAPGQLSSPVLNVMNPTPLPESAGLGASLNALAGLNFRDMSGLAGTQANAQAGLLAALDATTAAGMIAGENMKTEAQKSVAMGQVAADVAKTVVGAAASNPGALRPGGLSGQGALINHGRELDRRTPSRTRVGSDGRNGTVDGQAGGGSDGGGGTSENGVSEATVLDSTFAPGSSFEEQAFGAAVFPLGGGSVEDIISGAGLKPTTGPSSTASAPASLPTATVVYVVDPDFLIPNKSATGGRFARTFAQQYGKYELGGAAPRGVGTFPDLAKLLSGFSEIGKLVLFYHGAPGQIFFDGRGLSLTDFASELISAVVTGSFTLPKLNLVEFLGCTVGQNPAEMEFFGRAVSAKRVSAYTYFTVEYISQLGVGVTAAAIKASAEYKHYDGYFLDGWTETTSVADAKPGENCHLVAHWLVESMASPDLPLPPTSPTAFDPREKTHKPFGKAKKVTGNLAAVTAAIASILGGGVASPPIYVTVEI